MRTALAANASQRATPRTGALAPPEETDGKEEEAERKTRVGAEAGGFATELVRKIASPVLREKSGGAACGQAYDLSFLRSLGRMQEGEEATGRAKGGKAERGGEEKGEGDGGRSGRDGGRRVSTIL